MSFHFTFLSLKWAFLVVPLAFSLDIDMKIFTFEMKIFVFTSLVLPRGGWTQMRMKFVQTNRVVAGSRYTAMTHVLLEP
jgi:hypothetical protein